jgi:hypothetical protein
MIIPIIIDNEPLLQHLSENLKRFMESIAGCKNEYNLALNYGKINNDCIGMR